MSYDIACMQNPKYGTNEPVYETERDSLTQRIDVAAKVVAIWGGIWGLADANYYIQNREPTKSYYTAQETIFKYSDKS